MCICLSMHCRFISDRPSHHLSIQLRHVKIPTVCCPLSIILLYWIPAHLHSWLVIASSSASMTLEPSVWPQCSVVLSQLQVQKMNTRRSNGQSMHTATMKMTPWWSPLWQAHGSAQRLHHYQCLQNVTTSPISLNICWRPFLTLRQTTGGFLWGKGGPGLWVYRKVVVAQGSLVPGRKVTGSVGNLSSLASYCYISIYL